jgi:omega-6 fatty acid desaturase (delta-12 desaturase)
MLSGSFPAVSCRSSLITTFATDASAPKPAPDVHRVILKATRAFAVADDRVAIWQVATSVVTLLATLALLVLLPGAWRLLTIPLIAGVSVRLFVLQHDCGHGSLFRSKRTNDAVGLALSWWTGVPFEPWRTEHAWHHNHQGKLDKRGVDRVNSPMTAREARRDPAAARLRDRFISVPTVMVVGVWSLMGKRKRLAGFFPFRPGFPNRIRNRDAQRRGLLLTVIPYAAIQLALIAGLGLGAWGTVAAGCLVGGSFGALLFWMQHNFAPGFHGDGEQWDFVDVAVEGSSYLRFGPVLRWVTGSIGLHHVHHLNPHIPNYRLEDARCAIPELSAVDPLSMADVRHSFTHVFWDEERGAMVTLAEAIHAVGTPTPDEVRIHS